MAVLNDSELAPYGGIVVGWPGCGAVSSRVGQYGVVKNRVCQVGGTKVCVARSARHRFASCR